LDEDLHVGEAPDHRLGKRHLEIGGDRFSEARIRVAGDELDRSVLARHPARLLEHFPAIRGPARPGKCDPKSSEPPPLPPPRGAVITRSLCDWQYDGFHCPESFLPPVRGWLGSASDHWASRRAPQRPDAA